MTRPIHELPSFQSSWSRVWLSSCMWCVITSSPRHDTTTGMLIFHEDLSGSQYLCSSNDEYSEALENGRGEGKWRSWRLIRGAGNDSEPRPDVIFSWLHLVPFCLVDRQREKVCRVRKYIESECIRESSYSKQKNLMRIWTPHSICSVCVRLVNSVIIVIFGI